MNQILKQMALQTPLYPVQSTDPSAANSDSGDVSQQARRQGRSQTIPHGAKASGGTQPPIEETLVNSEMAEALRLAHPGGLREPVEEVLEEMVVENADMVIAAPYLPQLWDRLELVDAGKFKTFQAAERAIHLLQFMVDENTESPEYHLALNKILCGVKLSHPVIKGIDISDKERNVVEGMIQGMIENWNSIGQTSIEGFRESFFQRGGRLALKNDAWHLKVEQRAFDMLLDSIPWSFSTIKHSCMERVVYVKWR